MKIFISSRMDGAPAVSTPQADIHVENDAYAAPDLAQEEGPSAILKICSMKFRTSYAGDNSPAGLSATCRKPQ